MNGKKIISKVLWLIVWLALAAAIYFSWSYWEKSKNNKPKYRATQVAYGNIIRSITATGQLASVVTVQVGSQISGQIQKIFVDFNSPVKKDQIIAQIDPATYQAQVTQAEGDLANAKATLALNKPIKDRNEALFGKGMVSQAALDKAVADFMQAEASVKVKEASLAKAKVDLERCTIYSPIDGIVISRDVDVGQTVAASLNTPTLFVIANDLTKMQIDASVSEADIGNVEEGQEVVFTVDAFPERKFKGKVSQVRNAATTTQNVVTYDTIIDVENTDLKLKPGMTANVSIITARSENVLMINNAALRFTPSEVSEDSKSSKRRRHLKKESKDTNEKTVYLLGEDQVSLQKTIIKVGVTDGTSTEVVEGLQEGDVVVTGENINNKTESGAAQQQNPFMPARPGGGHVPGRAMRGM